VLDTSAFCPPPSAFCAIIRAALKVTETSLPGVLLIEPSVYEDTRGFFMETYHAERFRDFGIDATFVQDNHSRSARGVVRGLHYQEPNPQGKLVRCTRGTLFDVAVDIRRGSPAFGQWYATELSEENKLILWVPPGFAHGFCAVTEVADLVYKCTTLYDPANDRAILWNDPDLGIVWPDTGTPSLSPKDASAPRLRDATVLPTYQR
jgi:dTDP-4-dehydrorhamnose 3,5-epimerase